MRIINPDMPEPYKYESDYRNIPREYLNPRIPEGRKMVKWQAFKTMPEQYERLEQYIQDQNKVEKPILSDDQLKELNQKLAFKMFNDPEIVVRYFKDGYIHKKSGYIHKVDALEQKLYMYEETILRKVNLKDIVEIK